MIHLAIAHTDQDLDWLHALPVPCAVTVYTCQPPRAEQLPEGCQIVRVRERRGTAGLLLQHLLALARQPQALQDDRHGWTILAPGDALTHAPALLELMAAHETWGDVQVLSTQGLQRLPARVLERDQRDWIGDLPVRAQRYCLATLAPLGRPDPEAAQLADLYLRRHGLDAGSNLIAHFLDLCGFEALALKADAADLGVMAPGGVFAVRNERLLALLQDDGNPLQRLDALARCDPLYRQMLEQSWLHLMELPFIALDALPRPQGEDAMASAAVARVSAAIDALLQRTQADTASRRVERHAGTSQRKAAWSLADLEPLARTAVPAAMPDLDDPFAPTVIEPRMQGLQAH